MTWTRSLTRLREHEIEERRKRLAAVLAERDVEMERLRELEAERVHEMARAAGEPAALYTLAAWRVRWLERRQEALARIRRLEQEEGGCREALTEAFAELKKVERVAAAHAREAAKVEARRDGAVLDELALRGRKGP